MDRRDFVQRSALSFGAGLLTNSFFAGQAGAEPPAQQAAAAKPQLKGVRLAIATICTDGFSNQHHEPAMKFLPQIGFKNVELNLLYPDQIAPSYVSKLKQRCAEAGLTPTSVQGTSFGADGRHAVMKDYSHKLLMMQHAQQLGCRIVKFTGARRGTKGGLKSIIEVCKELAPAAEEMGVLLTLENHASNNLETIEDYDKIFEAIDSPNIGLCLKQTQPGYVLWTMGTRQETAFSSQQTATVFCVSLWRHQGRQRRELWSLRQVSVQELVEIPNCKFCSQARLDRRALPWVHAHEPKRCRRYALPPQSKMPPSRGTLLVCFWSASGRTPKGW